MEIENKLRNKNIAKGERLVFFYIIIAILLGALLDETFKFLPEQTLTIVCSALGAFIVFLRYGPRKGTLLKSNNKMTGTGFFVMFGAFFMAQLVSMLPSLLVVKLTVNEESVQNLTLFGTTNENPIMTFLFMGLCCPICEEIVFRGCIGNNYKKYGIWFGMIISTLLFSMYHANIYQLISTFLPGIVLFYVAMNYSLKWSILFHFINNTLSSSAVPLLQKLFNDSPVISYAEYGIKILLVIIALALMKKDNAVSKVKAFLSAPENENGVFKASLLNIWFIIIVVIFALLSAMSLMMLSGKINMP